LMTHIRSGDVNLKESVETLVVDEANFVLLLGDPFPKKNRPSNRKKCPPFSKIFTTIIMEAVKNDSIAFEYC
jgi:hypothetical protein